MLHKFEDLAKETVTWETGAGNEIEVTIRLERQLSDETGLGDWKPVRLDIVFDGYIDGKKQNADYPQPIDHPVISHTMGRIGITPKNYERICAAEERIKQHNAWQRKSAAIANTERQIADYEAHAQRMIDIMATQG